MIYLFLADGFEEVEAITPLDYLRRCKDVEVKTVAVNDNDGKFVTGAHGIIITADVKVDDVDLSDIEMIVLPGGMPGTTNLEKNEKLQSIIDYSFSQNKFIGAICAAPTILGHKNMLEGKTATCYTGCETELYGANYTGNEVEIAGNIITARGAGVANQFAFKLIEVLKGEEVAEKIKSVVLY